MIFGNIQSLGLFNAQIGASSRYAAMAWQLAHGFYILGCLINVAGLGLSQAMGAEIIGSNPKRFQPTFDQALILNLTDGLLLQAFAVVLLGASAEEKVRTTLATKFNPGLQRFTGCFAQGKRNRLLGLLMLIIFYYFGSSYHLDPH